MSRHGERNERNSSIQITVPEAEPTLLPMLVGGLVLIVAGAVVVMSFV